MKFVKIFDTTLRDGAQAEGISFSVSDKIQITKILIDLGIEYIEAGNPGSNPKDLEYFEKVKSLKFGSTKLVGFGSTRRKNILAKEDANVVSLLKADTKAVAIFGKSWDLHVEKILSCSLEENLNMIEDTISFFKDNKKEVIFDAEHFFDGYKANKEYALKTLDTAVKAGADVICLCETNGGFFPYEIEKIVKNVTKIYGNKVEIGIHCHNDGDMGVANTITAALNGATQLQGTFLGYGERCGNANLVSIIANLQLKLKIKCLKEGQIENLTSKAHSIAEISNIAIKNNTPFVGKSAFAHKGGMHIDGVNKITRSFEHLDPELIGNQRRFLMSEVAGRTLILKKIQKIEPNLTKESKKTKEILDVLKKKEHVGYIYESAGASFEILVRKLLDKSISFFDLIYYKILNQEPSDGDFNSQAIVKIRVNGVYKMSVSEGNGPVHALDRALRQALEVFYPELTKIRLTDYKVRVLDQASASGAKVRVLISTNDSQKSWDTVGVSTDLIEASWIALMESLEYKLLQSKKKTLQN